MWFVLMPYYSVCDVAGLEIIAQGEGDIGESMCRITTHCNYYAHLH